MSILEALIIGVGTGIISGLVGIGGGAVVVPLLVYAYKMNQHMAQGTSLAMLLLPSGFLAFWRYYKAGNADLKIGLLMAVGVFIGGYFGGKWAQSIDDTWLRRVFALFLAALAAKMFFQK